MFINIINNDIDLHNLIKLLILKTNVMEQFKRAQVIMLPTNNKSHIYSNKSIKTLGYIIGKVESDLEQFPNQTETQNQHLYIISDDEIKNGDWFIKLNQNKIIQCKDKSFPFINENFINSPDCNDCKKIIATTDTSLIIEDYNKEIGFNAFNLPQPSQQFIEKYVESYNKSEIITDVLVEYEPTNLQHIKTNINFEYVENFDKNSFIINFNTLKINPKDNTITIKKVKDSWNREEVIELLTKVIVKAKNGDDIPRINKWIKENL